MSVAVLETPNSTVNTPKNKRRVVSLTLIFFLIPFLLNALVVSGFTPANINTDEGKATLYRSFGTISIYESKDLRSGGIGKLSVGTMGYVNLLSPSPYMYINSDYIEASGGVNQTDNIFRHEIAHIEQKRMVAEKAGGYPNLYNPVRTAKYLYYMFKLDADYQKTMPKVSDEHEGIVIFPGLESAADCRAGKTDGALGDSYVDEHSCSELNKTVALKGMSGTWPTAQVVSEVQADMEADAEKFFASGPRNVAICILHNICSSENTTE